MRALRYAILNIAKNLFIKYLGTYKQTQITEKARRGLLRKWDDRDQARTRTNERQDRQINPKITELWTTESLLRYCSWFTFIRSDVMNRCAEENFEENKKRKNEIITHIFISLMVHIVLWRLVVPRDRSVF